MAIIQISIEWKTHEVQVGNTKHLNLDLSKIYMRKFKVDSHGIVVN